MYNSSLQREEIERVYGRISPFELKDKLINLAEDSRKRKRAFAAGCRQGKSKLDSGDAKGSIFHFRAVCGDRKQKSLG